MSVFGYHFMIGFFSSSRHHSFKGFWAEYAACRMFAQLMLLAALQSWFAWPDAFNALPHALRAAALALAAAHSVSCLRFALRKPHRPRTPGWQGTRSQAGLRLARASLAMIYIYICQTARGPQ